MHPVENRIEPTLLRRINERRLLEVIQQQGPSSRASLTRASGMTAPTVSKAVESLLKRGLVEEIEPIDQILGRPGRLLCMAARSAAVIGVVIESDRCCLVSSGLDGRFLESQTRRCVTPSSYDALLDVIEFHCRDLIGVLRGPFKALASAFQDSSTNGYGKLQFLQISTFSTNAIQPAILKNASPYSAFFFKRPRHCA